MYNVHFINIVCFSPIFAPLRLFFMQSSLLLHYQFLFFHYLYYLFFSNFVAFFYLCFHDVLLSKYFHFVFCFPFFYNGIIYSLLSFFFHFFSFNLNSSLSCSISFVSSSLYFLIFFKSPCISVSFCNTVFIVRFFLFWFTTEVLSTFLLLSKATLLHLTFL